MPDLSEQLSSILQNPEARQNIMAMLSSLQQTSPPPPSPQNQSGEAPFDFSSLFQREAPLPDPEPSVPNIDINMLMKIQQIFSKMSCDDRNVNLLLALKPHLREQKKVDDAINILRLMSVLPALSESGIFGGGFR